MRKAAETLTRGARAPRSLPPDLVQRIVKALHPHKFILLGCHGYGMPGQDTNPDFRIITDKKLRWRQHTMVVKCPQCGAEL